MPPVIRARIHSLFGAEWIDEHRQLHTTGSCKCAADFSYYQTPEVYGATGSYSLEVYNDQEHAFFMAESCLPPYQGSKNAEVRDQTLEYSDQHTQASYADWSQRARPSHQYEAHQPYWQSHEPCIPTGQPGQVLQGGAQPGAWSTAQQVRSILSSFLHFPSTYPESPWTCEIGTCLHVFAPYVPLFSWIV